MKTGNPHGPGKGRRRSVLAANRPGFCKQDNSPGCGGMGREDLLRLLNSVNIYGVELRLGFSKGELETTWELIELGWRQGIWDKYLGNLMGKLIGVGLGNFSICIFWEGGGCWEKKI